MISYRDSPGIGHGQGNDLLLLNIPMSSFVYN